MFRKSFVFFLLLPGSLPVDARQEQAVCGTHPENWKEELHLHRMSRRALARAKSASPRAEAPARLASRDADNIVIMQDSDGVIAKRNEFNLHERSIVFLPQNAEATKYRFETAGSAYEESLGRAGQAVNGLDDDDSSRVEIPFAFPFYGRRYRELFVNSDGNLTFETGDSVSADRSVGRLAAGAPRIAPLFDDLDTSKQPGGVRVLAESGRFVVTWINVPEYQDIGTGGRQTVQVRLYPDGRIEFAYGQVDVRDAVVGISPGRLRGSSSIVSFATETSEEYTAAIAERFGGSLEVDVTAAAQKFYENHDDAYDYLVFYNNQGVAAGSSAVAFESTVRNHRTGYGDSLIDIGQEFGSASRLQAVINMGPLAQYPTDPDGIVRARKTSGDTPLTVLAHEAGHLFLAYASVRSANPVARPMLGFQGAHWNFAFNSEASLLEGNRIEDRGPGVSPRFRTTGAVEAFSPLDQYLMGFRYAEEVPPTFLVTNPNVFTDGRWPQVGVEFEGERRDITIQEIMEAEGRRTPDPTVSQRRFRFAIVLIVREGTEPSAADRAQVEQYRTAFEQFFARATGNRAMADTSLRKSLRLSMFPAAGVIEGRPSQATLTIEHAAEADLVVSLTAASGVAAIPGSVRIPAGATSATFSVRPVRAGVEEIRAEPLDGAYDIASAKVQVSPAAALRLVVVSGDRQTITPGAPLPQPVVIRLTDENALPYAGVTMVVSAPDGGSISPLAPVTDADGRATIEWTPGSAANAQLSFMVAGVAQSPIARVTASRPGTVTAISVVNAASYESAVSPGAIATIYGSNLSTGSSRTAAFPWPEILDGVRVLVNGRPSPVLYVSGGQVNFLAPPDLPQGTAGVVVATGAGSSAPIPMTVRPTAPGIFFDTNSGHGAILNAGTAATTFARPAARGGTIEIYCTGLGPVRDARPGVRETVMQPDVRVDDIAASVLYSGLAPGYLGLYQVNITVPAALAPGIHQLSIGVNGVRSNFVRLAVQ